MKKFIIAIGLVLPLAGWGQIDRSVIPAPGKAPVINIKNSEIFKTSNGITVILSENHKIPKVTFDLVVGPGPLMEGNKAGLSDVSGSLVMSGTSNRSKDELDAKIDYIGADLGADRNSLTLTCLTKHLNTGLDLMSDVLLNASFPESEFDRIIKQYESSLISAKSDPTQMGQNAVYRTNFPNHPFGEIMTEESLKKITRDDVINYYKSTFVPHKSYLVIVGDIDRVTAEQMVNQFFGSWKGGSFETPEYSVSNKNKGNRVIFVKKPGAVQSYVQVSFPVAIKPGHEDQIPLTVMNGILGDGGFGNRLMQNLREDKAYTYGCGSSIDINKEGSWFSAGGSFRNEVTDSAITQILFEIDRMTNEYVKDEELSLTKSSMSGGFARSLERPSTVARFALNIIRYGLDQAYYQNYLKAVESVTKDAVLEMAQKYLNPKNCNIIVVGNEDILERLKVFDADGQIELLDAFGQEVKEMTPATISADELLKKYTYAVTQSSSDKEVSKKLKKVKSVLQNIDMTMSQAPFPFKSTQLWAAPNSEAMKLEAQGMMLQKTYFDGSAGYNMNMQTGKTDMTAEEIAAKNKSMGLIPEMNYATSGMTYELLGIENQNGTDMYVLKSNDGETERFDYFNTTTFMKIKTFSISKDEEGNPQESVVTYSDYRDVNGILFPYKLVYAFGEIAFNGEVKEILINSGSLSDFK